MLFPHVMIFASCHDIRHPRITAALLQLEEFKAVHTEVEGFRTAGYSAKDIKRDITLMETEKEQLYCDVE